MTKDTETILDRARAVGLERAVAEDPQSVIAAARRAEGAAQAVMLQAGRFGEPWPPMKAAGT